MADEGETKVETKEVHVGLTPAQLDEKMLEVRNELKELHASHTRDSAGKIESLESELKELKDAEKARKKAEDDKESSKGTENTLVVPAGEAQQVQTHEEPGSTPASEATPDSGPGKKRLGWW